MSVEVTTVLAQVKDANGNYHGINGIRDRAMSDELDQISSLGDEKL